MTSPSSASIAIARLIVATLVFQDSARALVPGSCRPCANRPDWMSFRMV
jgi:hypothetical protein